MQNLKINGFIGIKKAEIDIDVMTLIIGEQASGKSIIARLIYFFNEYFANLEDISLTKNEHKGTYDKKKKEEFYQIFPPYSWEEDEFSIIFKNERHSISIFSNKKSSVIEIKTDDSVAKYFRNLRKKFSEFIKQYGEELYSQTRAIREFRGEISEEGHDRYESPLFVPSSRSFYATIRDEIFSILSIDNKIDKIILQFGEFYETTKVRSSLQMRHPSYKIERDYFKKIVKGNLIREDGRDWIEMERGRIELSKASSGQQEASPLLMAISRFPSKGRTLIIEEPEAHLFPSTQIDVLEFMCRQAINRKTSIIFTTHSPYLLSSMNVYIMRGIKKMGRGLPPDRVRAYSLIDGICKSIVDDETSLISADYIDSVSENISSEFEEALLHEEEIPENE